VSDATSRRLKVSREGIILIKSFEGFRPRAVRTGDDGWVVGYGHTASAREGSAVSEPDAELLLQYDLLPVVKALNDEVAAPLNQHQFDALASFAISVGVDRFLASDVLQRLNAGHAGEAADALIGWPETTPPDARLRRRAAERALFVADPGTPMHLAELLAAPLPPKPVENSGSPAEAGGPADARAAAVAALLGESPSPAFEPAVEPSQPEPSAPAPPVHLHRYAPYAAPVIGPLPGFPTIDQAPESEAEPGPSAGAADSEPVEIPSAATAPEPASPAEPTAAPEPAVPVSTEPVIPLVSPAPGISPFPPMDEPPAPGPANEADVLGPSSPTSEPGERAAPAAAEDDAALFNGEPAGPVMRHEVDTTPSRRFDWSVNGAYAVMGLTGLAACAASAAAFRLAMVDQSSLNDYSVIGWVLAVIGVICVGVSSWNLYVRWGRRD